MLLLSRDHIYLQVYHQGSEVQIIPPPGEFESSHFIYTYAQGEEELAQGYLDHAPCWDPGLQLRAFFIRQGWQVRGVEG